MENIFSLLKYLVKKFSTFKFCFAEKNKEKRPESQID